MTVTNGLADVGAELIGKAVDAGVRRITVPSRTRSIRRWSKCSADPRTFTQWAAEHGHRFR
ncbi:hypothetical protein [Nocardia salmonicida]|uniref:Uncharacterized protein n=1 Tax=Nocardia salmonicida TaxID=53431 RepID=A0ABZ1NCX9_9NOCA